MPATMFESGMVPGKEDEKMDWKNETAWTGIASALVALLAATGLLTSDEAVSATSSLAALATGTIGLIGVIGAVIARNKAKKEADKAAGDK